jgi:hypothetical protein
MGNERLRTAMAAAHVDIDAVVAATGVAPKTVQRWLAGRTPYPRHRCAIAALLGEDECYLWPTPSESSSHWTRFRQLWRSAGNQKEALRQIQHSFGATLPDQLINIYHHATIIIDADGSAVIEQAYKVPMFPIAR